MSGGKPLVELFVKAAPSDREGNGPCPICQQWFMVFYTLVEKDYFNLRVTPVNTEISDNHPPNYTRLGVGRRLPVAWIERGTDPNGRDISGFVADGSDEMEKLMDIWKCPELALAKDNPDVGLAESTFADLYKVFNNLLKNDNEKPLLNALRKLNGFLSASLSKLSDTESNDSRCFLLGSYLSYADCQLMPKLQHIRVAGKIFKNFEIPHSIEGGLYVWLYMETMYQSNAFLNSCPADRDILLHYYDKVQPPPRGIKPSLMPLFRTTDLPSGLSKYESGQKKSSR